LARLTAANFPTIAPMTPSRRDFRLTRSAALVLVGALLAGPAAGVEDLPAYPPPLAEDLSRSDARPETPAAESPVSVTIVPRGAAALPRPLPPGATAQLRVVVRNSGTKAITGLTLAARVAGLKPEASPGWQTEAETLVAALARLNAGAAVERRLSLLVEQAPPAPGISRRISVEARSGNAALATAEFLLPVADCAAAYHARLAAIRTGALQAVKAEADAVRKSDPSFPYSRLFPTVGGRNSELAKVERLATAFVHRAGADSVLAGEDLSFNFRLWASDLTAYTSQNKNPALCSGALALVDRYRKNIAPTTNRIEAVRAAAASALELARKSTGATPSDNLARVAERALEKAGLTTRVPENSALAALTAARASLDPERKLEPEATEALSVAETAAVLAAAAARAEKFAAAIHAMLAAISLAARETCVCAY
jgi:hypothetical protein